MRAILAQLVLQLVLMLASTDMSISLSRDWQTGEPRCHHSPEKVSMLMGTSKALPGVYLT